MFDISRNDKIISIPNEYGLLKHLFSFKIDGLNNLQIPRDLKPVDGKNIRPLMEFLSQRLRKQVQHSYLKVFMAGKSTGLKRTILQALDPEVFRKPGTQFGFQINSQSSVLIGWTYFENQTKSNELEVTNFKIDHLNISLWDLPYNNMFSQGFITGCTPEISPI